jgi:hypothetical protein
MLIAYTHFVEVDEEDVDARKAFKAVPLDTRMLYNLVMDSLNGALVVPVKLELLTSKDYNCSMVFIFCGSTNKQDDSIV